MAALRTVRPVNPYIAGAPLREERGFYGRLATLDWVIRELRNPSTNALVLFGQRRIGKTTLLLQLQHHLPGELFVPVYFDLQDQATRPLGELLGDLADTIAEKVDLPPLDFEQFDDRGRYFRTEFLTELKKTLDSRRLVLLLDEFDVLDQVAEQELPRTAAAQALFPFLRRLMLEEPQLAFVFVVGRRAEDLTLDFSATFKASLTREIWTLDEASAVTLVRQAEANETLKFSDAAVARILELTSRHPYLTQLLCQRIWERAHPPGSEQVKVIEPDAVNEAIWDALDSGYQAFAWLWDGLSPAERIYASAFAEITQEGCAIPEDQVIQVLATHAARLRTREVEMAPQDLVRRRVLTTTGDTNYCFSIELFRLWVQRHKPLREVKNELDQIDPLADRTFDFGLGFFNRSQWETAIRYFNDALAVNPRHFRARLYLGETWLAMGQVDDALAELEKAYQLDREEARLPLARALLAQAETSHKAGKQAETLAIIDRVLELSPQEQAARSMKADIWNQRGHEALAKGELEQALAAYQEAGNAEKVAQIEAQQRQSQVAELAAAAAAAWSAHELDAALEKYQALLALAPDDPRVEEWQAATTRIGEEDELARLFAEGLGQLNQGDWQAAQRPLVQLLQRRPDYEKDGRLAAELLVQAVKNAKVGAPKPRPPLSRRSVLAIAGGLVLVVALAVAGWALFFQEEEIPDSPTPPAAAAPVEAVPVTEAGPPSDKWVIVMTDAGLDQHQIIHANHIFPTELINESWGAGFDVSDLAYGDYGSGRWRVVMTQFDDNRPQFIHSGGDFPETRIKDSWTKGYDVSSIAYHDGLWVAVMTYARQKVPQGIHHGATFPNELVTASWEKGYDITSLTYGDGRWAVVMTYQLEPRSQLIHTGSVLPREKIRDSLTRGYEITSLAYGSGRWIVVMTSTPDPRPQTIRTLPVFPNTLINSYWSQGYDITALAYGATN